MLPPAAAPESVVNAIADIEASLDDVVNHGSDDELFIASYLQGHFAVEARQIEMQEDAWGTRMRPRIIVLALLITSCSSNRFLAPATVVDETNSFVEFTDKKASAVKLKPLRDKTIIEGNKEIRVWVGFGIVSSEDLLILKVDKKGKVTGRKMGKLSVLHLVARRFQEVNIYFTE